MYITQLLKIMINLDRFFIFISERYNTGNRNRFSCSCGSWEILFYLLLQTLLPRVFQRFAELRFVQFPVYSAKFQEIRVGAALHQHAA